MNNSTMGVIGCLTVIAALAAPPAATAVQALSVDHAQVASWNRFADALYLLHRQQLVGLSIRTKEVTGGYAGNPDFYREVSYLDADSGRLLSRIQWETRQPDTIHNIAVYVYDADGGLSHDYYAGYLPEFRNAPVQTLISVHHRDDGLRAYRQFDASGVRIYEQCRGRFFDEGVMVSIDEDDLPSNTGVMPADVSAALYSSCFEALPTEADRYLDPLLAITASARRSVNDSDPDSREAVEANIELLSGLLAITPGNARWHLDRGDAYFQLHAFDKAVADYSRAIELDPGLDEAWFGRGMALARDGRVREGIADLDVYIQRHPASSRAHTKRGVRYIWLGDLAKAQQDLEQAVQLDPGNAEANDDLGVVYAQQQRHELAARHFRASIQHDPSYQKAHHNLAMIHFLSGRNEQALSRVDEALSRNSLMLKASILEGLGRHQEARAITEQAEFLPGGNWSERFPLQ
jgi:tetratricopeptide (TPR) repeat protein